MNVAASSTAVTSSTAKLLASATTLVINGSGFDINSAKDTVTLSSGSGTVTHASATSLTISVSGLLPGPLSAVVSADGVSTFNTQVATVIPVVTPSTASLAANATSLVINGFGFDPIADDDIVSFSGGVTEP